MARPKNDDAAIAAMYAQLKARLASMPPPTEDELRPETPEEIEAARRELLEYIRRALCGDVARCKDPRCRRSGRCRRRAAADRQARRRSDSSAPPPAKAKGRYVRG